MTEGGSPITDEVEPDGVAARIASMSSRAKVLIVLGVVLVVLAVTGRLQARNDIDIERDEAIAIAREQIDFEPVDENARLVRQGFSLVPVWAVSFSIPAEGSARDFERLTTVEINAENGEVIRVAVDNLDE